MTLFNPAHFLIFSLYFFNSVLAQDNKDILYGLPPLPLSPEERKVQKPSDQTSFRDIPPVPQEDINEVQKNFVRVAPTLPPPAPTVAQQALAQFQQQVQPQFQQQPQAQFQQPRVPGPPVPTTVPPPPKYHQIQLQPDYREPIVREYLRELEDFDWNLHYAEQNVNNFRGPARSSGVQQAQPQNGQQPNTDYLREIAEYDDLQAIERRNHAFENPPQLHVDLPTTQPTPYYNVIQTSPAQEVLVPLNSNQQFNTPPPNFGNQQGPVYGPRPGAPNALPTVTPHPLFRYNYPQFLDYVHNVLGFRGPHPLNGLLG